METASDSIVGSLIKRYVREINQISSMYSEDDRNKKEQEVYTDFELSLSEIFAMPPEESIICTKQDFYTSCHPASQNEMCIYGVLPMKAIQLMKEKFNIQINPGLFLNYVTLLLCIEYYGKPPKGREYNWLLDGIRFSIQEDGQRIISALESAEDLYDGLCGMIILHESKFYEPIYQKFCLSIQSKSRKIQEKKIASALELANKHKNVQVIALLSAHPCAIITPQFLKISDSMDFYEGVGCILKCRPEFWDNFTITNKLLVNSVELKAVFQQRLKNELDKLGICDKEVKEIVEILSFTPGIDVPDMVRATIHIIQCKQLLRYSTKEMIELEFGSFLSIWNQKGVLHPKVDDKRSKSCLGSFYKYKPELYTHLVSKLEVLLPNGNRCADNELYTYHKQFCFKLAVLFPNREELDAYFEQLFAKKNKGDDIQKILYEASNFDIPTQGYWDVEAWFSFVKRNKFNVHVMAFLRSASDIDMKMRLGDTIFSIIYREIPPQQACQTVILKNLMLKFKNNKQNLFESLVKQCPLAYENLIQQFLAKKLKEKRRALPKQSEEQVLQLAREEVKANLSEIGDRVQLLLKNILEIYDLRHSTLKSLVALRLQDFAEIPKEYKDAVVTALENGYSNEDIKDLIEQVKKNKQVFSFVPSVIVDGAEIDDGLGSHYNNYQLDVLEKTDPMALVAGLKTRCCQHLKNEGVDCVMHAYNSIYGATYRLADKKDPNQDDWLAQSWVVLSECGTIILFDSIEFSVRVKKEEMVVAFFKKASEKLLRSNPHLQEIWVGTSASARLQLEKYGYAKKQVDPNFTIAGYSKDSYSDADSIVVLMTRNELKVEPENVMQTQEESKLNSEYQYQLRYGIDTYLKPGKIITLLGLSQEARRMFNGTYAPVVKLLREEPTNPLVEEGFVSSDPEQETRYREGEYYITYEVTKRWLNGTLNPKIKVKALAHHVYAGKEEEVPALLREAQENASIKTFTIIAFCDIHAVSIYVDFQNKVSFILDSDPGTDLGGLAGACKNLHYQMRVITPEKDFRLQKDYYSCVTFALKSARYFAKYAEDFSRQLTHNATNTLMTVDMPPALLKMCQTDLKLTDYQNSTMVSKKNRLTLFQYKAQYQLTENGRSFNTAALKTRQNILKQLSSTMQESNAQSSQGGACVKMHVTDN